jgi:hypothetical protein
MFGPLPDTQISAKRGAGGLSLWSKTKLKFSRGPPSRFPGDPPSNSVLPTISSRIRLPDYHKLGYDGQPVVEQEVMLESIKQSRRASDLYKVIEAKAAAAKALRLRQLRRPNTSSTRHRASAVSDMLYNKALNHRELDEKRLKAKRKQEKIERRARKAEEAANREAEEQQEALAAAKARKAKADRSGSDEIKNLPCILVKPPKLETDAKGRPTEKSKDKVRKRIVRRLNKALGGKTEEGAAIVSAFMVFSAPFLKYGGNQKDIGISAATLFGYMITVLGELGALNMAEHYCALGPTYEDQMELLELRNNLIRKKQLGKWDANKFGDEFASAEATVAQIASRTGR